MEKYKLIQLSPLIYKYVVIYDERKNVANPPKHKPTKKPKQESKDPININKSKYDCLKSVEAGMSHVRDLMEPTLYQAIEEGRCVVAVTLGNSIFQPIDLFIKTVNSLLTNIKKRLSEYGYFSFIEAIGEDLFHLHFIFWELEHAKRKITKEFFEKYWHNGTIKIDILSTQEKVGSTIFYLTNYSNNPNSKKACQKRSSLIFLPAKIRIVRHSNRGVRKPLSIQESTEFDFMNIKEKATSVISTDIKKYGMLIHNETLVVNGH